MATTSIVGLGDVLLVTIQGELSDRDALTAQEQLANLRHCEMHSSVILSESDEHTLKKLGINLTCEPMYESKRLYHG